MNRHTGKERNECVADIKNIYIYVYMVPMSSRIGTVYPDVFILVAVESLWFRSVSLKVVLISVGVFC